MKAIYRISDAGYSKVKPEYIDNDKELMKLINDIKNASIEDGGTGAFYIYLKKKPTK